jgi:predicted RNase H-like nuclease
VFGRAVLASTLYEIVAGSSGAAVIGVDIPLGMLPDRWRRRTRSPPISSARGAAACSGCRRGRCGWSPTSHRQPAVPQLTGAGLSRQSWSLRPKLLEANAIWERHPGLLFEGHPELSFRQMAGEPLAYAKKTWTGQARRRELLARHGIVLPDSWGPRVRHRRTTSWTRPRWRGARTGWRPARR